MNELAINIILQNNKHILTIQDTTIDVGVDFGWRNWTFARFFDSNSGNALYPKSTISVTVLIETKDNTYTATFTRDDFVGMATDGNTNITEQLDVYYNIALLNGALVAVAYNATNIDLYSELPDGIYSITYALDADTDTEDDNYELESSYVLTDSADEVILSKTDDVQDKMFTCPNFNIEESLDYLVYSTMYATLQTSRLVGQKETILNTLDHINNEDYEYYQN